MNSASGGIVRLLTVLLLAPFVCLISKYVNNREQPQDQKILERLLTTYDERVRPPSPRPPAPSALNASMNTPHLLHGPVLVKVNILIRMLSKIDVVNMEYTMQITLREQWLDKRLAYAHLNFTHAPNFLTVPHVKPSIWMPDSFFPNEKSAHRHLIDSENMFLRIHSDGTILYSARLSLVCSCPMHLQFYPLDVQYCDFDLVSYAHTTRDIIYEWDASVPKPVQLKEGVGTDLPNFKLVGIDTGVECASYTNTGAYACLRMRMRLSRLMTYFVLQLYFPTTMIVIVSWVSFWIDMHSTAGRVALAMTTLLTITTITGSINAKLPPPASYSSSGMLIPLTRTLLAVHRVAVQTSSTQFSALIEYAVVCYKDSMLRAEKSKRREAALRKAYTPNSSQALVQPAFDWRKDSTPLFELSSVPSMSEKREIYSPSSAAADGKNRPPAPCTFNGRDRREVGIASYLAASLGIASGVNPTLSTLVPISSLADMGNGRTCSRQHANPATNASLFYDQLSESPDGEELESARPQPPHRSPSLGKRKSTCEAARFPIGINLKFKFTVPSRKSMWNFLRRKLRKPQYCPALIDYYARVYMPFGFLVFNVFYWGICLYLAAEQSRSK